MPILNSTQMAQIGEPVQDNKRWARASRANAIARHYCHHASSPSNPLSFDTLAQVLDYLIQSEVKRAFFTHLMPAYMDQSDLTQEAYIILLDCIRTFNPHRETHFISYFRMSVRRWLHQVLTRAQSISQDSLVKDDYPSDDDPLDNLFTTLESLTCLHHPSLPFSLLLEYYLDRTPIPRLAQEYHLPLPFLTGQLRAFTRHLQQVLPAVISH